jgi:tetratricopeptide (TPR) repeat protein
MMSRREVTAQPPEFRAEAGATESRSAAAIVEAMRAGDMVAAARAYFAFAPDQTRRLLDPGESLALAKWLAAQRYSEAALTMFRRHLRDYPAGPSAAEAHVGAGLVQFEQLGQVAPAYQHFLDALDQDPDPVTAARARAALAQIAALQKYRIGRG